MQKGEQNYSYLLKYLATECRISSTEVGSMVIVRENAGPIIRRKRRELELSQAALAKQVGCSTAYLCEIERGVKVGSLRVVIGACEQLGLPAPMTCDQVAAELERHQALCGL